MRECKCQGIESAKICPTWLHNRAVAEVNSVNYDTLLPTYLKILRSTIIKSFHFSLKEGLRVLSTVVFL